MMLLIRWQENYTGAMRIMSFLITALMLGGVTLQNHWMLIGLL